MEPALPPIIPPETASQADYSLYVLAAYALAALIMLALILTGYRRRAKAKARLERAE